MTTTMPIDPRATPETRALLTRLHDLTGRRTLVGHQDDLAYGREWSGGHDGRSDVKETVGKLPGVIGFDLGGIELLAGHNLDGVPFLDLIRWVREAHAAGSLVTLSWHSVNPVTNGGYGKNTAPLSTASVLPGGREHEKYLGWLANLSMLIEQLTDAAGRPIPLVFRPFHEHSGDWFWWGIGTADAPGHTSPDEFAALWRFTVEYLTDVVGLHNLLYAISPDRSRLRAEAFEADYLRGYPGDDFVDLLGVDDYVDAERDDYIATLEATARIAADRGKLVAQTETAFHGFLAEAAGHSELTRRHLWHLFWRNAPTDRSVGTPLPGEDGAGAFAALARNPFFAFAGDLPELYSPA